MDLSNAIKKIRQKSFMTQEQFASEMGVAFSTVNRWENGRTIPNITAMKQLKELCEQKDISFGELEEAWLGESAKERN